MSDQSKATATYRRLFGYLRPYWLIFLVGIFANLLYGFVDTEFVKAFEPLIDDAIYGDDKELLAFAPLFILIIIVLRGIASFTATYAMSYVGTYLVHDLRRELFTKYVTLPAQFFDQHKTGDLISTLTYNSEQLKQSTTEAVTTIVRSLAVIIFALIGMFQNSWKLSLIFLVIAPVIALLVNVISRRFRTISTRIQNAMSDITHVTQEGVENYQTIRVYAGQEGESKRFAGVNNSNRQQSMKLESTRAASVSVIQVIAGVGISVVFYFGIQMIEQGELSGGAFIATLMLMALILKPLKDLTSVNAIMQRGIAAAQSLFDIIDLADEPNKGKASVPKGQETITVAIDSFQYIADKPAAIKDFYAQFAAGKTTAIVGQSGSGKSTLIGLLLRFYTPQQGKIEIAGKNINELELTDYRSAFAYVSQDVA
ncbi:MAG: ATP-binding cassette domain-containing protein, partial [Enterobacterales bacterium]|nr:ATP-binding cassette domain-containing protein [Enterobacterales bacterium]